MTGDELPGELLPDPAVVAQAGPWTVRSCVTAACTRCGAAPLDEDTRLTPHFASTDQAREELPRDWGWTCAPRSNWPKDDEVLCPDCASADGDRCPQPPEGIMRFFPPFGRTREGN